MLVSESLSGLIEHLRMTSLGRTEWSPECVRMAHETIDNIGILLPERLNNLGSSCVISPTADIHTTAILGSGVVVGDGAKIGPYSYLRSNVIVYDNVEIGYGVELDHAIIHEDVRIMHQSCIGRSIIGARSNLAYGFVVATHRLDRMPVRVQLEDRSTYISPAKHHGAVIGEDVQAAVNVSIMPGKSVSPSSLLFS